MASSTTDGKDPNRDDISIISSIPTESADSTTCLPPYSALLFVNASSVVIEKIISYLELEHNDKKDQIISDLLMNGRQALYRHREDIIPEVLSQEQDYSNEGESPLLKLIKQYITEKWEALLVNQPIIVSFINNVKKENSIHFDNVLTRMAEYGLICTKASLILSIVLQLFSESIDDECYTKTNKFVDLWNSITIDGIHGINTASEDIPEEELNEQTNNKNSPVYLALRMYFEDEIKQLFSKLKIPDRHNTLYDVAIDNVTENGWLEGIKSITKKITKTHYNLLAESIQALIEKQLSARSTQGNLEI
ncbi:unnamed protein product [Rotaria sp. Silwood1]|nr:unnamed protein product [Rotaria sp. Silwood1]CAF1674617.1 unnamed protein product [Rotaria sp. Silwood1]CAF3850156.1 unnamed protein product [Rotaria sp. Silwood1]CAF3892022.1 unnamed protein product [Rotaria sp. Silwood1]CAF3920709.1 unnamed protein product [Rotaria sp. Silwood1]